MRELKLREVICSSHTALSDSRAHMLDCLLSSTSHLSKTAKHLLTVIAPLDIVLMMPCSWQSSLLKDTLSLGYCS